VAGGPVVEALKVTYRPASDITAVPSDCLYMYKTGRMADASLSLFVSYKSLLPHDDNIADWQYMLWQFCRLFISVICIFVGLTHSCTAPKHYCLYHFSKIPTKSSFSVTRNTDGLSYLRSFTDVVIYLPKMIQDYLCCLCFLDFFFLDVFYFRWLSVLYMLCTSYETIACFRPLCQ